MDMYTMNENFISQSIVDEFISVVWVERYSQCGEVQLVTAATPDLIEMLAEGTFLGLRGTTEVMLLETQSIENELLTVQGKSLVNFLDQRLMWKENPDDDDADVRVKDYTVNEKVGQAISDVVEAMVISATPFGGLYADANLDWDAEEIEYLELGDIDTSGDDEDVTFTIGPLYQSISQVAEKFGVGISLYLESSDVDAGYVLKFKTYTGEDRTSDSMTNELVRLQPDLDSLSEIKELRSIQTYKNTAYVYFDGEISIHYEDPLNIQEGFARRVLVVDAENEALGWKPGPTSGWTFYPGGAAGQWTMPPDPLELAAWREAHARDALANYNYIRAIDGQTSPDNEFQYGTDYGLGDVIELEGLSGNISVARITEFIRSQDRSGERQYPTISVVTE